MMGMQIEPAQLFYEFRLDDHVPSDHLLRRIDRFLDLASVRSELKPFYSTIGRPSIDPELMMRMLIVGYCMASGPNGGCAKRYTSTSPIAGSAGSGSTARCRTIQPSRATGMVGSGRAISSGTCSRLWSSAACVRGWSAGKASPSMPV